MSKTLIIIIIMFFYGTKLAATKHNADSSLEKVSSRHKILVFTSDGGFGHKAASASLQAFLEDYDVKVINVCEEVLTSIDPIRKLSFGKWHYGNFYDKMLQNGWTRTLNFLSRHSGPSLFHYNRKKIQQELAYCIRRENPDLVISVFSFINYSAYCAAQECKKPFLCMTLDADLSLWLQDLERCSEFNNFMITVGTKTTRIMRQLAEKGIPMSVVREVGIVLRKDFFENKNHTEILKQWNLPNDKPIIMLIRGGSGSLKILHYVKALMKIGRPLHLLACVGKNTALAEKLKRIHPHNNVTISIIPFTTRISDLMFVSNLLITPPSPNTCSEAIHFEIPILVDYTAPTLFWERATLDLINRYGTGAIFKNSNELPSLILKYISNKGHRNQKNLDRPNFERSIRLLVAEMINNKTV